jgi:hypothetical protein
MPEAQAYRAEFAVVQAGFAGSRVSCPSSCIAFTQGNGIQYTPTPIMPLSRSQATIAVINLHYPCLQVSLVHPVSQEVAHCQICSRTVFMCHGLDTLATAAPETR